MRKLLKTSILVFAFCFCAFAQTNNTLPCPTVSVTGPPGISAPNQPITFTVSIGEEAKDFKIAYNWTINAGEIVEGQGTTSVSVLRTVQGQNLTATVTVSGLPDGCNNTASETTSSCELPPQPIQIDEFSESANHIDKNRINEIVRALQNDPTAQLYIIFKHKEKILLKTTSQKEREISNSLVKAGLAADRITAITGFGQNDSVEFFLVPAGATPPKIEDN
jgi:hypothetical protein